MVIVPIGIQAYMHFGQNLAYRLDGGLCWLTNRPIEVWVELMGGAAPGPYSWRVEAPDGHVFASGVAMPDAEGRACHGAVFHPHPAPFTVGPTVEVVVVDGASQVGGRLVLSWSPVAVANSCISQYGIPCNVVVGGSRGAVAPLGPRSFQHPHQPQELHVAVFAQRILALP